MKHEEKIDYKIDDNVLKKYVETINSLKEPISRIKRQLNESFESNKEQLRSINYMSDAIRKYATEYPYEHAKIFIDVIKQIMMTNNGMISTRMIEPLNISRQYLSIMENNNDIEKISRGVYLLPSAFEDSYFSFQQKYRKVIFSHMNALYFYGLTEEFPYNYTVTVPQRYHVDMVNEKCNVFYVSDDIYGIGIVEVQTPNGNNVRAYDKERCICDIVRSKSRMDIEQVKKSIKLYIKSSDKDMTKLSDYAKKMGISEKVMEMVGTYYE